jgi:hypothetical protein
MERVVSSFTAIVVVSTASSKETYYNYILCPHTRPPCTMCVPRGMNLTSNLAKFSL